MQVDLRRLLSFHALLLTVRKCRGRCRESVFKCGVCVFRTFKKEVCTFKMEVQKTRWQIGKNAYICRIRFVFRELWV